jgi:hypothetical protein
MTDKNIKKYTSPGIAEISLIFRIPGGSVAIMGGLSQLPLTYWISARAAKSSKDGICSWVGKQKAEDDPDLQIDIRDIPEI